MALNFPSSPTIGDTFTDGTTTWEWDGEAWVVLASGGGFNNYSIISGDSGSTTANQVSDTLSVVGGTGIATSVTDDTLTISYAGGGGGSDQNLWYTIAADSGSTSADNTTDTLDILGGTDISTSIVNDTLTINFTGSAGASSLDGLSDVNTAGVANGSILYYNTSSSAFVASSWPVAQMYMPAITMLYLTENNNLSYRFDQYGSVDNPTIYAISGTTIAFDLSGVGGHPLQIQDPTSTPYNTGLVHVDTNGTVSTGASAQGKSSGVLYWKVPFGISGNYRYQCTAHAAMVGAITIKAFNAI